jgi:hypothetical protein
VDNLLWMVLVVAGKWIGGESVGINEGRKTKGFAE